MVGTPSGDGLGTPETVEIPLRGVDLCAVVDAIDAERVSGFVWRLAGRGPFYAVASGGVRMHRLVLGLPDDATVVPDHINGDGLDNRRCNLRIATPRLNVANSRPRRTGSSRYRGVSRVTWDRPVAGGSGCGWRADVSPGNHQIYLGLFQTEDEAALAFNAVSLLLNGAYARLNEVPPTVVLSAKAQRAIVRRLYKHIVALTEHGLTLPTRPAPPPWRCPADG